MNFLKNTDYVYHYFLFERLKVRTLRASLVAQ